LKLELEWWKCGWRAAGALGVGRKGCVENGSGGGVPVTTYGDGM